MLIWVRRVPIWLVVLVAVGVLTHSARIAKAAAPKPSFAFLVEAPTDHDVVTSHGRLTITPLRLDAGETGSTSPLSLRSECRVVLSGKAAFYVATSSDARLFVARCVLADRTPASTTLVLEEFDLQRHGAKKTVDIRRLTENWKGTPLEGSGPTSLAIQGQRLLVGTKLGLGSVNLNITSPQYLTNIIGLAGGASFLLPYENGAIAINRTDVMFATGPLFIFAMDTILYAKYLEQYDRHQNYNASDAALADGNIIILTDTPETIYSFKIVSQSTHGGPAWQARPRLAEQRWRDATSFAQYRHPSKIEVLRGSLVAAMTDGAVMSLSLPIDQGEPYFIPVEGTCLDVLVREGLVLALVKRNSGTREVVVLQAGSSGQLEIMRRLAISGRPDHFVH